MSSSRRLLAGSLLIIVPWALLIVSIVSYSIASFVISALVTSQPCAEVYYVPEQDIRIECHDDDFPMLVGTLINIALGGAGILGVVGILVGNPFGLYLLFSAMTEKQKVGM